MFGALFIVGGIIGSGIAGVIVEIYKNYKAVLTAQCILTTIGAVWLLFAMRSLSVLNTSLACFIVGGVSLSSLPVGIDLGVEITHPIPESISSGLLMGSGQIVGVIFTVVVSVWITNSGNSGVIGGQTLMIIGAAIAIVVSFFIVEDLRRIKEQKERLNNIDSNPDEHQMKEEGLII